MRKKQRLVPIFDTMEIRVVPAIASSTLPISSSLISTTQSGTTTGTGNFNVTKETFRVHGSTTTYNLTFNDGVTQFTVHYTMQIHRDRSRTNDGSVTASNAIDQFIQNLSNQRDNYLSRSRQGSGDTTPSGFAFTTNHDKFHAKGDSTNYDLSMRGSGYRFDQHFDLTVQRVRHASNTGNTSGMTASNAIDEFTTDLSTQRDNFLANRGNSGSTGNKVGTARVDVGSGAGRVAGTTGNATTNNGTGQSTVNGTGSTGTGTNTATKTGTGITGNGINTGTGTTTTGTTGVTGPNVGTNPNGSSTGTTGTGNGTTTGTGTNTGTGSNTTNNPNTNTTSSGTSGSTNQTGTGSSTSTTGNGFGAGGGSGGGLNSGT